MLRNSSRLRLSPCRALLGSLATAAILAFGVGDRPVTVLGTVLLAVSVALASRGDDAPGRVVLRLVVGLGPAVVLIAAVHDLTAIPLPPAATGASLGLAWILTSRTLGAAAAGSVVGSAGLRDVAIRMLAVAGVTVFVAGAMARLLLPSVPTARRLSWILGEEDNAHVVGVAREVLSSGPRGVELADQFGTAFMNVPLMLVQFFGGLPSGEVDPRLRAISAFTVSTLVVILLAGLAMAILAALPSHVHLPQMAGSRAGTSVMAATGAAGGTAIGMSLLVVLPMRTGFLTFVWGLTFVLIGAATAAALPRDAGWSARTVLLAVLAALTVLVLSAWPFILPALASLFLLPLTWIKWAGVSTSLRQHKVRWVLGLIGILLSAALVVALFSRWGPTAEVLSYGRGILLASASGISADDLLRRASFIAIALVAILLVLGDNRKRAPGLAIALIGPVVGGLALYGGLLVAAAVLTDGELNYSGVKLLYGIVVLAAIIGLLTLTWQVGRNGMVQAAGTTASIAFLLVVSPTSSLVTEWWSRTDLGTPPHAVATITAIEQTTANLPIRCLPAPGARVTETSRLAAYFCARWMEDAFNEGRFQGHRDQLLRAESDTFEPVIEAILESSSSEYLFSLRMILGPGWFGWDGRS